MSALVLDAGAFVAVERNDRMLIIARLRVAQRHDVQLRSTAIVVAQVWRDTLDRQARLARLLHLTSDPQDIAHLVTAAGKPVAIIPC